jgi:preprotein translocase subunit YajC
MKFTKIAALLLSVAAVPAVAQAQDAAKPTIGAGAMIYGPQGGEVGTVEKVQGDMVVVKTDKHSATLPKGAIGTIEKGLAIGFTREQLNQAVEAAAAQAKQQLVARLVPGAAVSTSDGQPLGVIKSVDEEGNITIDREAGAFALKQDLFALNGEAVTVRMTAQQVEDALAQVASAETSEG